MANRFKGEASVSVDGKKYTLRCDFNAMIALEELTGRDAFDVFADFEGGDIDLKVMRQIMLSFLLRHHPDATIEEAGDVLSEDMDVLKKVLEVASPTAAEVGDLGNVKGKKKVKAA